MPDEFDRFLATALTPPERLPDRQFVSRTQARIALEDRLEAQRRSVVAGVAKQLVVLIAVAAAAWWLSHAVAIASWFAESPALGLAILLTGFGFLVAVIGLRSGSGIDARTAL
jgi:hypothetical protein